jgi:hypothetical protein
MTEKQQERIRLKIKKIKSELAADKKRWGGFYDDSRGLRYLPLEYYIKLKDYSGGKRYINWFYKNFPDDGGFPEFLFECTIVLFYSKKLKEANRKLFETFASNTYVIDKFLGNNIRQIEKYEGSNIAGIEYLNYFNYTSADEDLSEFTKWLNETYNSDLFKSAANEHIDLQRQLKVEHEYEKRVDFGKKMRALVDRF